MGKKKKTSTEMEKATTEETEAGRGETNVSEPTSPPRLEEQSSTLPRLDTIRAILNSIDSPAQMWPKEALKAVLRRYERMRRKGLDLLHSSYKEQFGKEISLVEFKRKAES